MSEININSYNPTLLLLWGANMDIKYIGENSLVLNRYISNYVTKSENQSTKEIWESIDSKKSLHSKLKSFALKSFKCRELGAYECADILLGHVLYRKSRTIQYLSIQALNHIKII